MIRIASAGQLSVGYNFKSRTQHNVRQIGVMFDVPSEMRRLTSRRKGLWNCYPDDHIGRLCGSAHAFYDTSQVWYAGSSRKPDMLWPYDDTVLGSHDFRATRTGVYYAALMAADGASLEVLLAGGAVRTWATKSLIHLLVAEYNRPSSECFSKNPLRYSAKTVHSGDIIDCVVLKIKLPERKQ